MTNSIVTLAVAQQVPPTPSKLQRTGAFVSVGGTTTAPGTFTLLTSMADLTAILAPSDALTTLTWSGGVATGTTTAPHGWGIGDAILVVIAGSTIAGYNGQFTATVTGASTFTYPHAGTLTSPATGSPTVTLLDESELNAMGTTFFAQGSAISVYVYELGEQDQATAIAALQTFINANPKTIYSWLVPREWASSSDYQTMVANYEATTAEVYFFTTMTASNYGSFSPTMKCVLGLIEYTTIPATEFTLAAAFYGTLNYNPSSTNQVPPTAFQFGYGVTAWPPMGNQATLALYKAANVNYYYAASEGGISTAALYWGTTMDGNDFTYWYSIDNVQINSDLNVANEVINGSNSNIAPLYYDQNGIDRLQNREVATMRTEAGYGLALGNVTVTKLDPNTFRDNFEAGLYAGQVVVNAVPFQLYVTENPDDYPIGTYNGLQVVYTPNRGFKQILINVLVANLNA